MNAEWEDYKSRVLARTDGANIHKVNGLLGLVINSEDFISRTGIDYPGRAEALERAKLCKATAEMEIKALTGVSR